jgi:hypothetical protein
VVADAGEGIASDRQHATARDIIARFDRKIAVLITMRGLVGGFLLCAISLVSGKAAIDRHTLVTRHNPVLTAIDYASPLTVGNGGFAFTVDATGLQTFPERYHREGIPLETLSRWCWVEDDNPQNFTLADANRDFTLPDGRIQGFPTNADSPAGDWLRRNPRNQPLGVIGLDWSKDDGTAFVPEDIQQLRQTLDLWRGVITSRFQLGGQPVEVLTVVDPRSDRVGVRVRSELVRRGKLRVKLSFPRGHDVAVKNTPGFDWSHPETHQSKLVQGRIIERTVGRTHYTVTADRPIEPAASAHVFHLLADPGSRELACTVDFSASQAKATKTFADVLASSGAAWPAFWRKSAALDLAGSTHPLAHKLEERVVLSQYLTAVQLAGDVPPQESGLTCSTWYGKHHTEMIWWHAAHFALWNHPELLAKNLRWYQSRLPEARAIAKSRGLRGARWPKMVGPDARESPGGNPLIIWNQPHLIYLCELLYRANPSRDTLETYRDLVLETADCLASMTWLDPKRGQYVLGPPLWIVQEIYDPATSQNPAFELSYWRWTLQLAQTWRERLGLSREAHWDEIIGKLAALPIKDGKYVALESHPDTWENLASRHDHPEMLMSLGMLPGGPDVDRATMGRTLDAVLKEWDWQTKIWGWDYPMIAMTATRLGRPEVAIDVLLRDGPNNRYTRAGHCPQRSDVALAKDAPPGARRAEIAVYLPANGAFLSAVALMVAGWDGCSVEYPGFVKDGSWRIQAEGWSRLP